ncbi:MAG: biotin--[Oscillospiraceae bacterium]|nr:biotin--[acetyl-CoA-carboxylase] ligase [Oscillospiraceae bacterium]
MREKIDNTKNIGKKLYFFEELSSTNDWLRDNREELQNGTVALAKRQTGGKGRQGRKWCDSDGESLSFSVLLKALPAQTMPILPILAAVAVKRGIFQTLNVKADLKWPNDVLIDGKKIAGILCEAFPSENGLCVVCGIGINVMHGKDYFIQNDLPHAGSLLTQTKQKCNAEVLLDNILIALNDVINEHVSNGFSAMKDEYAAACVNIGKRVRVVSPKEERTGVACDVDLNGQLICRFDGSEKLEAVASGEVSVRGIYGYGE